MNGSVVVAMDLTVEPVGDFPLTTTISIKEDYMLEESNQYKNTKMNYL